MVMTKVPAQRNNCLCPIVQFLSRFARPDRNWQHWEDMTIKAAPGTAAIGIMCKAPEPGRTKTRLARTIGADAAARLSACFLRDVAAAIESVPAAFGRRGYGVYAPAGTEKVLRELLPTSFGLLLQTDAEFGNVLHGAMHDLLAAGHDCVLLVNGDSPTLPPAYLAQAIAALRPAGRSHGARAGKRRRLLPRSA